MSKCIEFVKNRIKECDIKIPLDGTATFTEMKFDEFVSNINKKMKENKLEGAELNRVIGENINISNLISYDENAEFQNTDIAGCVCDGTLSHVNKMMKELFNNIYLSKTVGKLPSDFYTKAGDYEFNYTVGNFVICTEHGNFDTEEKPWLNTRFTVFLPYKFDIKEKERQVNGEN